MIKVGIIGAGAIAATHIEGFLTFPEKAQITALADIYADKAAELAGRYDLEAAVFDSHERLLAESECDLVVVCTPPFAHAQAAVDALRAGRHVLVEKPMATSLAECDRMLAAAEASGKLLSVVAQNRFKTPMMKLKAVLESGLLGRLIHGEVNSFWWRGSNYYDLWWRGTWEKEGGGCTLNHAVHHIDLFQWMMGMPQQVQAVLTNLNHQNSEVEDFSSATWLYDDGRLGQVTASLVHHGEPQELVFQGERAAVALPWHVRASRQRENGFPDDDLALAAEIRAFYQALPETPYEGHTGQIANVLAALSGEEGLLIDGREGRKTLELVMAIYQSGVTGRRVDLPLQPEDMFYTQAGVLANAPHFYEKTKSVENFADTAITLGSDYQANEQES